MKSKFVAGILSLFPIVITTWIIASIIYIVTDPFYLYVELLLHRFHLFQGGLFNGFISQNQLVSLFSIFSILIALFFFIVLSGMMGKWLIMKAFFTFFEETLLLSTPLIRKVYKLCKDITHIFFTSERHRSAKAVLVSFFDKEQMVLGFVTSELFFVHENQKKYLGVFVPGSPNPLVGFFIFIPEELVQQTSLRAQEGLKWIISCGNIPLHELYNSPDSLKK